MAQPAGRMGPPPLHLVVFSVCFAFGILVGHQTLGVIDRDEARFAQASKQMLESGDYITPRFMDELRAKSLSEFTGFNLFLPLCLDKRILPATACPALLDFCLVLF